MTSQEPPADHVWDLDDVWGAEWLRPLFHVEKFNPDALFGGKDGKKRVWGVDFFMRQFAQLPAAGTAKEMWAHQNTERAKTYGNTALYRAERDITDTKRIRLRFFKADHPYELVCENITSCVRFVELAKALKMTCMWCPTLCPKEGGKPSKPYLVGIRGSRDDVPAIGGGPGETANFAGQVKLRVSPLPHESARLWVGSKDLNFTDPTAAEVREWIPHNVADFYVAAFCDIPPAIQGTTILGELVAKHLGSEFVPLLSTELESGKRSVAMVVVANKQKALRVSGTGAWTGARILESRERAKRGFGGGGKKMDNVKIDMVALTFRMNETSFLFVATKLKALPGDDAPTAASVKAETLKELLAKLTIGPVDAGDPLQKMHHCVFFGGLGFGSGEENHNWDKASKLRKNVDRLKSEIDAGRCFTRFTEDDLLFTAQLGHKNLDQRVLSRSLNGLKMEPAPMCYRTIYSKVDSTVRPAVSNLWTIDTLLPFLQALNAPPPKRNFAFKDFRFAPEKGSPYAWLINGKAPPSKMFCTIYCDFSEDKAAKFPIALNKDGTRYVPQDGAEVPAIVPATNAKCYLKKQYIWVTLWNAECEDPTKSTKATEPVVMCSAAVSLDGVMDHEGRKLPVELNMRNVGVYSKVRCKFTVIVTNDPSAVKEAMKIVESKEEPKRKEIEKEEVKERDKIVKMMPDALERAKKKEQERLKKDIVQAQGDEEAARRRIEEEATASIKMLHRQAVGLSKLNSDTKIQRVQFAGIEHERRAGLAAEEAVAWGRLQQIMAGDLGVIHKFRDFLNTVAKDEGEYRTDIEKKWKEGVAAIHSILLREELKDMERDEGAAREAIEDLELQDYAAITKLQGRDYIESQEREKLGRISRLKRQAEALQVTDEPLARHAIFAEEAEAWDELNMAFINAEDDIEQLAITEHNARLERDRVVLMSQERPGRKAIEEDFMQSLAGMYLLERASKSDVLRIEEARLNALEKLRRDLWTEAKGICDEIAAAQKDTRRLLMKREFAERNLIQQNSKAAYDRKQIAELVKLEHDRGHEIVYMEQQTWEELMLAEQRYRYEANKVKLKRQFRERVDVEDAEKAARRQVVAKYDTWWAEMSQAFEFGCQDAEQREEKRNDAEAQARGFIMQQEYDARLLLEEMDRASKKEARRHTQHRVSRDTRDRWEIELDEQDLRGRIVREEEQAFKLINLHAAASVKRIEALLDARQQDQIRVLYELPWHEQQGRAKIQLEEDKLWWALDTKREAERIDALYTTKRKALAAEEAAARTDIADDEDELFDDIQLNAFDSEQESIRKQVFATARLDGNINTTSDYGEARERLRIEIDEAKAREGYFEDMVDRFFLVMWGDILAFFEEARLASETGKRGARKAQQQRQIREKKCIWEEEAKRTIINDEWKTILDDIVALEPVAREMARRKGPTGQGEASPARPAHRTLSDWPRHSRQQQHHHSPPSESGMSVADMIRWEHQSQCSTPVVPPTMTAPSVVDDARSIALSDGIPPTLPDIAPTELPQAQTSKPAIPPTIPPTVTVEAMADGLEASLRGLAKAMSQDLTGFSCVADPTPTSSVYVGMTESVRHGLGDGGEKPVAHMQVATSTPVVGAASPRGSLQREPPHPAAAVAASPNEPRTVPMGALEGRWARRGEPEPSPRPPPVDDQHPPGHVGAGAGAGGGAGTSGPLHRARSAGCDSTQPPASSTSGRTLTPELMQDGASAPTRYHHENYRTLSATHGAGGASAPPDSAAKGRGAVTSETGAPATPPPSHLDPSGGVHGLPAGSHVVPFNPAQFQRAPPPPQQHVGPTAPGAYVGSPHHSPRRAPGGSGGGGSPPGAGYPPVVGGGAMLSTPAHALAEPGSPERRRGVGPAGAPTDDVRTPSPQQAKAGRHPQPYGEHHSLPRSLTPPSAHMRGMLQLPPRHHAADGVALRRHPHDDITTTDDADGSEESSSTMRDSPGTQRVGKRPDSFHSSVRDVYSDNGESEEYVSFEVDASTGRVRGDAHATAARDAKERILEAKAGAGARGPPSREHKETRRRRRHEGSAGSVSPERRRRYDRDCDDDDDRYDRDRAYTHPHRQRHGRYEHGNDAYERGPRGYESYDGRGASRGDPRLPSDGGAHTATLEGGTANYQEPVGSDACTSPRRVGREPKSPGAAMRDMGSPASSGYPRRYDHHHGRDADARDVEYHTPRQPTREHTHYDPPSSRGRSPRRDDAASTADGGPVRIVIRSPSQQRSSGSPSPMRIHRDLTRESPTRAAATQARGLRDASIQVLPKNLQHPDVVGLVQDPQKGVQTYKIAETTGGKTRGTDTWDLTPKRIMQTTGTETECVFRMRGAGAGDGAEDAGRAGSAESTAVGLGYRQPRPHEVTLRLRTFFESEDYDRSQVVRQEFVAREGMVWDLERARAGLHVYYPSPSAAGVRTQPRSPDADGLTLPTPPRMGGGGGGPHPLHPSTPNVNASVHATPSPGRHTVLPSAHTLFPLGTAVEVAAPLSPRAAAAPEREYLGKSGAVVGYLDDMVLVQLQVVRGGHPAHVPVPFRPEHLIVLPTPQDAGGGGGAASSVASGGYGAAGAGYEVLHSSQPPAPRADVSHDFPVGRLVEAHGIDDPSRSQYNGAHGTVVGHDAGQERVLVHFNMDSGGEGTILALEPRYLVLLPAYYRMQGRSASPTPGVSPQRQVEQAQGPPVGGGPAYLSPNPAGPAGGQSPRHPTFLTPTTAASPPHARDLRSQIRDEVDKAAADVQKEVVQLKADLKREKAKRLAMIEQHGFDMMMLKGDIGRMLSEGSAVEIKHHGRLRGVHGTVKRIKDEGRTAEVAIAGDASQIAVVPTEALTVAAAAGGSTSDLSRTQSRKDLSKSERKLRQANEECARLKAALADAQAREAKLAKKSARRRVADAGGGGTPSSSGGGKRGGDGGLRPPPLQMNIGGSTRDHTPASLSPTSPKSPAWATRVSRESSFTHPNQAASRVTSMGNLVDHRTASVVSMSRSLPRGSSKRLKRDGSTLYGPDASTRFTASMRSEMSGLFQHLHRLQDEEELRRATPLEEDAPEFFGGGGDAGAGDSSPSAQPPHDEQSMVLSPVLLNRPAVSAFTSPPSPSMSGTPQSRTRGRSPSQSEADFAVASSRQLKAKPRQSSLKTLKKPLRQESPQRHPHAAQLGTPGNPSPKQEHSSVGGRLDTARPSSFERGLLNMAESPRSLRSDAASALASPAAAAARGHTFERGLRMDSAVEGDVGSPFASVIGARVSSFVDRLGFGSMEDSIMTTGEPAPPLPRRASSRRMGSPRSPSSPLRKHTRTVSIDTTALESSRPSLARRPLKVVAKDSIYRQSLVSFSDECLSTPVNERRRMRGAADDGAGAAGPVQPRGSSLAKGEVSSATDRRRRIASGSANSSTTATSSASAGARTGARAAHHQQQKRGSSDSGSPNTDPPARW